MKTLHAIALGGVLLAAPALAAPAFAADQCLRPIDINTTKPIDNKTVNVETRGSKRPNFIIKFQNACTGLKFGDPLVFAHLYSGSQCITPAESVSVVNLSSGMSRPCMIDTITPVSKSAPLPKAEKLSGT